MDNLYKISQRANVLHKRAAGKDVFIYEDHRTILNVLFQFKELQSISGPLNLIMFDAHDDFCMPTDEALNEIEALLKQPSEKALNTFVEYSLNTNDDDWVRAGMELNLVGDCFLFNSQESSIHYKEVHQTRNFGDRTMYNLGEVWSQIGYKGKLNDPVKQYQWGDLWDAMDWQHSQGHYHFKQERKPYVFDVDLDCFTTRILEKTIAIPEDILLERFTEPRDSHAHGYYNGHSFVQDLIDKAQIVTICIESEYCGGIRESQKIFNIIDRLFFRDELGK